jgi:hypothetical protein
MKAKFGNPFFQALQNQLMEIRPPPFLMMFLDRHSNVVFLKKNQKPVFGVDHMIPHNLFSLLWFFGRNRKKNFSVFGIGGGNLPGYIKTSMALNLDAHPHVITQGDQTLVPAKFTEKVMKIIIMPCIYGQFIRGLHFVQKIFHFAQLVRCKERGCQPDSQTVQDTLKIIRIFNVQPRESPNRSTYVGCDLNEAFHLEDAKGLSGPVSLYAKKFAKLCFDKPLTGFQFSSDNGGFDIISHLLGIFPDFIYVVYIWHYFTPYSFSGSINT